MYMSEEGVGLSRVGVCGRAVSGIMQSKFARVAHAFRKGMQSATHFCRISLVVNESNVSFHVFSIDLVIITKRCAKFIFCS